MPTDRETLISKVPLPLAQRVVAAMAHLEARGEPISDLTIRPLLAGDDWNALRAILGDHICE